MASSLPVAPALTIGLDFSDIYTSFCILDAQGEILEEGKVRSTPQGMTRRFADVGAARMVLEVGTHSPWAHSRRIGASVFAAPQR